MMIQNKHIMFVVSCLCCFFWQGISHSAPPEGKAYVESGKTDTFWKNTLTRLRRGSSSSSSRMKTKSTASFSIGRRFDDIPEEVIKDSILPFLDIRDLVRNFAHISKKYYTIITGDVDVGDQTSFKTIPLNEIPGSSATFNNKYRNSGLNIYLSGTTQRLELSHGRKKRLDKALSKEWDVNLIPPVILRSLGTLYQPDCTWWSLFGFLNLREVDFHNALKPAGAVNFAKKILPFTNIVCVNFSSCNIEDKHLPDIFDGLKDTGVKYLFLAKNSINDDGVSKINLTGTRLVLLDLGYNNISGNGASTLIQNLEGTNLAALNLGYNNLENEGAIGIAKHIGRTSLHALHLDCTSISDDGALALSKNPGNLEVIDLSCNSLTHDAAAAFARNLKGTKVISVCVNGTLDGDGAVSFVTHLKDTNVGEVYLRDNRIDAENGQLVVSSLKGSSINKLDLGKNNLGPYGAVGLTHYLKDTVIEDLGLGYNNLGNDGAAGLAQYFSETDIRRVDFDGNGIDAEGAKQIARQLSGGEIVHVSLRDNDIDEATQKYLRTTYGSIEWIF